ncbi:MAG: SAM-dependent methyltransferase [Bacteroidetes bacterium]|nr:SAM-dependent methyltransferase [Bacteroidota bacterium]MBS1973727.1 SAM-dependent methyltransferase [Bacteroidota bacterium]
MITNANVYLIPTVLDESAWQTIPPYVIDAIKQCQVFFVENERSARRFMKAAWKEMAIDDHEWFAIHKAEEDVKEAFRKILKEGKKIGILSEAGCPGIADPGQMLVSVAQEEKAVVKPLVGPNSILLALMASGLNGQHFQFVGYLPIEQSEKINRIRELETESRKKKCTQIFIETPYRNSQLIGTIIKTCSPQTMFCIASGLTGTNEKIQTRTIADWRKMAIDIGKTPAIFLLCSA